MSQHRLGVATRTLGLPTRAHDSRRWQHQPHLSVSLAYVRDIFEYLHQQEIHFYRLSSQLAPYATHPQLPQFHRQIDECASELAVIGDLAREYAIRLTMHPGPYVQLGSLSEALGQRSMQELEMVARLFDGLGVGNEAVLVVHASHTTTDGQQALAAFARRFEQLSAGVRSRLAVENDDRAFDLHDLLWLHRRTGVRIVFDTLHHRCLNRSHIPLDEALAMALATWPASVVPKIHLSSPRTELRVLRHRGEQRIWAPLPNQHSDFLNPFECIDLLHTAHEAKLRPFDIMLEAKAHDLALLRLRTQIATYAPELVGSLR